MWLQVAFEASQSRRQSGGQTQTVPKMGPETEKVLSKFGSYSWKNVVQVGGRTEMVSSWFTAGKDNRVSEVLRASVDVDHVH